MTGPAPPVTSVDEYIASFPPHVQAVLRSLRQAIAEAAPDAEETISYHIPTFKLHGNLVHFAAFTNHVGFYPAPSGIEAFRESLRPYETSKGTIKFPLDSPLPLPLVQEIVRFRVGENLAKPATRRR